MSSKDLEVAVRDHPEGSERSDVSDPPVKKTKWRYLWDSFDKSPEERRFILKLDLGLLLAACLGFFIKYLDQSNLNNAFVSGMKEDLGMYANQLNYVQTLWTVGYIIGEVPSNILITRVRPSIWISAMQIVWSVLTMAMSRCSTVTQLYVLRFFIGLAESGFYPGMSYLIGSWYRKDEIAKRSGIFNASSAVATMFSGYLMTGMIGLDGKHGFKGWQWLFIMDGVISLPIAVASIFLIPDSPENTRAWYFNENDKKIALQRMELEGRGKPSPYTKAKIIKILKSWHIYLLPLIYVVQAVFALWLKAMGTYSVAQINNYPTITSAVQIIATLVYAWVSDSVLGGKRHPLVIFSGIFSLILYISMAVWDIAEGWKWACFVLMGQSIALSPMIFTWANEICSDDAEERAIVVAATNDFAYVINAWLPLIIWKQVDAPVFRKGYITAACMAVGLIAVASIIPALIRRDVRKRVVAG
ncbi:major facilitator superfamily domain-containing protein [Aspergillus pseudoustus]|uniref:Major facilitator superfamily domain-containing protein n=1 Tax=Aspergillus pseudoustus TaxID=1810923 RepID=A0ABR4JFZ4_9EURO